MPKRAIIFPLVGSLLIILLAFAISGPDTAHPVGRIIIQEAGIDEEICITGHPPDCSCCPSLWNGGKVTTDADLSTVQVGHWADIRTLDGGHYVMECVEIRRGLTWLMDPEGDVIVINGNVAFRLVRL